MLSQSCLILCDSMDCSPSGSSVLGILQARILGQEEFPSPGDLPEPRTEPMSPALWAYSLPTEPSGKPQVEEDGEKGKSVAPLLLKSRSPK